MSNLSLEEKIKRFPTIIFSRVVGWYSPLMNWNKGKQEEFKDRTPFELNQND